MPALEVTVDGVKVATVATDGLDVLAVNVAGTKIDESIASLDLSGGSYPENAAPVSLTWIAVTPLRAGQTVNVAFLESGNTSEPGKTIEELFPDGPISDGTNFTPIAEVFKQLRSKPRVRDKVVFRLISSSGASFVGNTAPLEHGFGFSVLWNSFHPERARVSLHTYTLDTLETRSPLHNLYEEKITYGGSVELHVA